MVSDHIVWNRADAASNLKKFRVSLRKVEEEALPRIRDCTASVKGRLQHGYDVKKTSLTVHR